LGAAGMKAAHKHVGEIDPKLPFRMGLLTFVLLNQGKL
jgi:hypothetical protein